MEDLKLVVVPRELYYHEVAYVRGLEKDLAEARAQIAAKDAEVEVQRKKAVYWHQRYTAVCRSRGGQPNVEDD